MLTQPPEQPTSTELALAREELETALALLKRAAAQPDRVVKAKSHLQLAALYALYGEAGVEAGTLHLISAAEADGYVCATPVYQALCWEFAAYCGDQPSYVRRGLKGVLSSQDPLALFHAARALLAGGMNRRAIQVLIKLPDESLAPHLRWRRWSLLGQAYANCAKFDDAVKAYYVSSSLTEGREQGRERLSLAECWLVLEELDEATMILDDLFGEDLGDALTLRHRYLWALAQTRMGNPQASLETLLTAYTLAEERGYTVFEILLELGRTYMLLGNEQQANASYEKACSVADAAQLSFITHEHAVMLSETGRFEDAKRLLKKVTSDKDYAHRALAFADLAHIALQQGLPDQASAIARYTLGLDANASACITLAEVGLQGFDYGASLNWLEQAQSLCQEGDSNWLSVQVLFSEVLAQQGYLEPERLVLHAERALRYLEPSNDWVATLQGYIQMANSLHSTAKNHLN